MQSKPTATGRTALHIAAEHGHTTLAETLVRHGVDIYARYGQSAHTALSWAITVSSFGFAAEMVRLGDKPDLFCAAGLGDLEQVKSFWSEDQLQPSPSATGSSRFGPDGSRLPRPPESDADQVSDALYMACRNGRLAVAAWLLDHGADPNFRGYLGATSLHWAEFSGNDALCALLRERGANDHLEDDSYGAEPRAFGITISAAWGLLHILAQQIEQHPERIDLPSRFGTPLTTAAMNGQIEAVALLVAAGANRSAVFENRTAADWGRERGHNAIASYLDAQE